MSQKQYKCPICGNELKWWKEYTTIRYWNINKNGKLSKVPNKKQKLDEDIVGETGGLYCKKCFKSNWDEETPEEKKVTEMMREIIENNKGNLNL